MVDVHGLHWSLNRRLTPTLTLNSEISIITRSIDRSYDNFFLVTMLLDVKAVMLYSLRAVWIKSGLDGR